MPSKSFVPRRIYLPALTAAVLLAILVIGSLPTRAQYLVEYPIVVICWRADGVVRIVASPDECRSSEQVGSLLTGVMATDWIAPLEDRVEALEADIADLQNRVEILEAELADCCPP